MAFEPLGLLKGELRFEVPIGALDDIRFERIVRGFAAHYLITRRDSSGFAFERGEGYVRAGRWDAFGYVDSGTVKRLAQASDTFAELGENVVAFQPRYAGLSCAFNIRVLLIFWVVALAAGGWLIGGPAVVWAFGFLVAIVFTAQLTRTSFQRKLNNWLARESWN